MIYVARYILGTPEQGALYASDASTKENGDPWVSLGSKQEAMTFPTQQALYAKIGDKCAHAFRAEKLKSH